MINGIGMASERMSALVEDLLLLARLDEHRPLESKPVRLDELTAEAVEMAQAVDPSRPIELDAEPSSRSSATDARLRQVVDNLLGNTRSHTPAGTPVRVRVRRDQGSAVLEVADEGPGMSAERGEPRLRALLPRRLVAGPEQRRCRARPVDRLGGHRGARRLRHGGERARPRDDVPRPAPGRAARAVIRLRAIAPAIHRRLTGATGRLEPLR